MEWTLLELNEAARRLEIAPERIHHYIEMEWVVPAEPQSLRLDREDVARVSLILDLTEQLGANEEAVPIILSLIDQLHGLRRELQRQS